MYVCEWLGGLEKINNLVWCLRKREEEEEEEGEREPRNGERELE